MFDPDSAALLEGGSALIVGSVADDGTPVASRGWGLTITRNDTPASVRILVDADDVEVLATLAPGRPIAITAADVPTLSSLQLKGRTIEMVPATDEDRARALRYLDEVFTAIESADGADRAVLERWVPAALLACAIEVTECFDQTPGPGAGQPVPVIEP